MEGNQLISEIQTPMEKLLTFMKEKQLDGVLLRKRANFAWITGGKDNHIVHTSEIGVADLLIFHDRKYCITTKMESARIQEEELQGMGFEWLTPDWVEGTDPVIKKLCIGKKVAADVPFDTLLEMNEELSKLRYSLTESEINRYRRLCQKTAIAVESTCREVELGWTEHEIAAHLMTKVMREGLKPQVVLVATDERIFKYRHPIPTSKKIHQYAMIVLCAEAGGLVANVTRFVHFGPLPKDLQINKEKLAKIDIAMNTATRPNVPIKEVLQIGIDTYKKVGYPDDWRLLHQGGPTGYASREFLAVPQTNEVVQLNQAFAWNPSIRGIKSEDTMIVLKSGNQFLTHTGEWVYIQVEKEGQTYLRPDILIR